ncbi:MAG: hypothetical protein AAF620_15640 [Bacteroidota bacterium]
MIQELSSEINKKIDSLTWPQTSALKTFNSETDCKELYEETCHEIGVFFNEFGFKKSKRKIQLNYDDYQLKILFASSGYNEKGNFIWLEINSGAYPLQMIKKYKTEGERLQPIIFSNQTLLQTKLETTSDYQVTEYPIHGHSKTAPNNHDESLAKYSNGINLNGLDLESFKDILRYIVKLTEKTVSLTTNRAELLKFISNPTKPQLYWIKEKRFLDYINLYYSNDDELKTHLNSLINSLE